MSVIDSGPPATNSGPSASVAVADVPVRADGVELLGHMRGSGYRRPPALVRRIDGQTLQLTPLLYAVLDAIDGERDLQAIAEAASTSTGRELTADNVRHLVDEKLRPLGVLRLADGSQPNVRRVNPLLRLRFRYVVTEPKTTRRITAPFAWLFAPPIVLAVVLAFIAVIGWLLFKHGLGAAAHEAFQRPGLLLAVFAITVLSAGFHEFGHAAAARYGGATPGVMGAGLYLAWPAFYTDVTDSYRLGRGGRIRTDLGGLYFNALLAVAVFGVWAGTGWDALLLVVATQLIQMLRQLPPLLRFDGYHLLADITGVPDLFHRIKPTLAGLWPTRWRHPETRVLKPWARAVVTLWVVVVVPLMLMMIFVTVVTLPRIVASAAAGIRRQTHELMAHVDAGEVLGVLANALGILAILVPMLGVGLMVWTWTGRTSRSVWRATEGRPVRRSAAAIVGVAVIAALLSAWWPHGNYRAISGTERGTLQDALPIAHTSSEPTLHEGQRLSTQTLWPSASVGSLPTKDRPALALVLVPRDGDTSKPTWVFPFDRPAPPGPGDNQALAVNTTNGSVVYDVAFAMVWADSDTVLNKNEAYAFASCSDCTTVAISFQVVLVVGQADVVVPQNLSGALNYNCLDCVTGALAMQLVVSVPENPSADMVTALNALWQQIADFSKNLEGLSFQEIHDRLVEYETQIVDVIQQYAPASASVSSSAGVAVSGAVVSGSSTTADASVSSSTSSSSANSATSPVATSTTPTDSGTAPTPTLTPTPTATP